eukprot:scaffold5380_cov131-Cylindrotheca_fusiformis.AAC.34
MTDLDMMTSRDSFHKEEEIIFYNSDEFMIDLLRSPKRIPQDQTAGCTSTSRSVGDSPSEASSSSRRRTVEQLRRPSFDQKLCFTTKFSDGVVVKAKPPSKSRMPSPPVSVRTHALRRSEESRPRSNSFSALMVPYPRSPKKEPGLGETFDCEVAEANTETAPNAKEKKTSWHDPVASLNYPKSVRKSPQELHRSIASMASSSGSIDSTLEESPKTLKSPCAAVPPSPDRSSSGRIISQRSSRTRKTSNRTQNTISKNGQSPKSEKPKSGWMVSPATTPLTPRSSRKSKKKCNKPKKASSAIPTIPDLDMDGVGGAEKKMPTFRRPPFMRPLDKILVRDVGSATTATTFFTADTEAVDYSMSHLLPMTKEVEKVIFKRVPGKKRDIAIEDSNGEELAYLDYSQAGSGKRFLTDKHGRFCAVIILQSDKLIGNNVFKICGNRPASKTQRLSNDTGYYTWAEVRNSGSLGGKFCLKRYCEETLSCSIDQHVTKPFGSLFNTRKSRGYAFLDSKKVECAKMAMLNHGGKGIKIAPDQDMCLMIAYAAVVHEMLENRLR